MEKSLKKSRLTLVGTALVLLATHELLHAQNAASNTASIMNSGFNANAFPASGMGNSIAITNGPTDIPGPDASMVGSESSMSPNALQEKTTLDYRAAPLVDVLRHLASATKINIAVSPTVEQLGTTPVTVWLTDVTYETALRTILDLYRLGSVLENGVLRIDSLDNLKKEQDERKRNLDDKVKLEPTRILVWPLNYAKASEVAPLVANALKSYWAIDSRISVQADTRSNKLIIEGTQTVQTRVKALLENIDKRKQQITIEARIIEASNEVSRTLRVNWGARFGFSARNGFSTGRIFPNSILGTMGGAGEIKNYPVSDAPPEAGALGLTLGAINGLINIDGILKAYETESLAHIIASPSMTVLDNEKATFQEVITIKNMTPVAGTAGTSFDSKLSLEVTPLIAHDNTVELDVSVDRDTPTTAPSDLVQGKIARNAKTKLAIRNGETAVIGGLYQNSKNKTQGRIPLLGRLPIIGFLFRANEDHTVRTEIMILITPRIQPNVSGTATTDIAAGSMESAADMGGSLNGGEMLNGSSVATSLPAATTNVPKNGAAAPLPVNSSSGNGAGLNGGGNVGLNNAAGNTSLNGGGNVGLNNAAGNTSLNGGGNVGLNNAAGGAKNGVKNSGTNNAAENTNLGNSLNSTNAAAAPNAASSSEDDLESLE